MRKGESKLTARQWELVTELRQHREDLREEARQLREQAFEKGRQANMLTDAAIADKFDISKGTISFHFRVKDKMARLLHFKGESK